MVKIPLNKKILTIKGEPVKNKFKDKDGKEKERTVTIRDYLLIILSTKFTPIEIKETFWATKLGIEFSDEKNTDWEISDDKTKFLRRLIENNKAKVMRPGPMGQMNEVEVELFFPFEVGQLLIALGVEEPTEEKK